MRIQRVKYKDIEQIPQMQVQREFKEHFFGSAPAPFIGRFGYPQVTIGVLSPQFSGDVAAYDSPRLWHSRQYSIGSIASMRYQLVNSRMHWNVKKAHGGKFLDICQEAGMAQKGVELEVHLQKKPTLDVKPEQEIIPFGPASEVKNARITANTKVDTRVEKVVSDTDLKATAAIITLYNRGFEESQLNKLLSVGMIGIGKDRTLVPTRWSITAVDDTIGKKLIADIKNYQPGDYQLYFGGGWGNHYLVLFFPEVWSYELFETYLGYRINPWSKKGLFYSTDYEGYEGRKNYAEECAGGYYAARLAIVERMHQQKRQQSALVLRFITQEYNVPLGVWVCREATRKSLASSPLTFASEEEMLNYAQQLIQNTFGFDIQPLLNESKLLTHKRQQRKLSAFM
jgi:hypothetical protein